MALVRWLLCVVVALSLVTFSSVSAADGEDEIVGVWEREEYGLEETWVIKKSKDKWSVSGSFWQATKIGEVGNFKGKDVKYADGTLSFAQDYFKLPKGRKNGTKTTASAEGNRLNITLGTGATETKDTMERAGDASELLGTWSTITVGMKETWTFEKDKKGEFSVHGTFKNKAGNEVGRFTGTHVRYFKRVLWFNQQYSKLPPTGGIRNGSAIACTGYGNEMRYVWANGKAAGKAMMHKEDK